MTESSEIFPPGWYPQEDDSGTLRYWNGSAYTEYRAPKFPSAVETGTAKVIFSALALGFGGAAGGMAAFGLPVLLFALPLGLGIAGAALSIVALLTPGKNDWFLVPAIIGAIVGIVVGIDGYNQFSDASAGLEELGGGF